MKKNIIRVIRNIIPVIVAMSVLFTVFAFVFSFADDDAVPAAASQTEVAASGDTAETGSNTSNTGNSQPWWYWVILIAVYAVIFGLLYLLLIRPQQKKRKQEENMRNSLALGDTITTIGGIVGRVVNIHDDDVTVETSIDRSLITFKNWAIRDIKKVDQDSYQ